MKSFESYTQEPDAFENESENQMEREWYQENNRLHSQQEKEKTKYLTKMFCILCNLKDKLNIDFIVNEEIKRFQLFFYNKISFDTFMAQEKDSYNFNKCLCYEIDKNLSYSKLNKDAFGVKYITFFVK